MIKLIMAFLISCNVANAQNTPHFSKVENVYRRDKKAIDDYAMEFIENNPELFFYKQTSYLGNHRLEPTYGYKPYTITDSAILAKCIYIRNDDTFYSIIGFFAKDNRTKIELLYVKNFREDAYIKEFLYNRFDAVIEKYKGLLRSKNNDKKNW